MIPLSRRNTLVAGIAIILATNSVVLSGVAYNRSGSPEAVLRLTQREARPSAGDAMDSENSQVAIALQWRLPRAGHNRNVYDYGYGGYGGQADWLNEAKLAEIGFDASSSRRSRQLPRRALLVLEMDGPAYRSALNRAEERAAADRKPEAEKALQREKNENSRLFVVDSGLDADILRSRYADRGKYAIVEGKIGVHASTSENGKVGYVDEVSVPTVNVPLQFRQTVQGPAFLVHVAYGRRLEPWVVEASVPTRGD